MLDIQNDLNMLLAHETSPEYVRVYVAKDYDSVIAAAAAADSEDGDFCGGWDRDRDRDPFVGGRTTTAEAGEICPVSRAPRSGERTWGDMGLNFTP